MSVSQLEEGMTLASAIRQYRYWLLISSILVIAIAYGGAYIHLAQILIFHGVGPGLAATAISIMALGILIGRVVVGFLFDYFWAPAIVCPTLLGGAVACLFLIGSSTSIPYLFAAAFLLGVSSGGETDAIAYLTTRYFGMLAYGRIYGMLYMAFALGASVSPLLYGIMRDQTGNYDGMLMVAAILFASGGLALLALGTYRYPLNESSR